MVGEETMRYEKVERLLGGEPCFGAVGNGCLGTVAVDVPGVDAQVFDMHLLSRTP